MWQASPKVIMKHPTPSPSGVQVDTISGSGWGIPQDRQALASAKLTKCSRSSFCFQGQLSLLMLFPFLTAQELQAFLVS